jgi:hypothetical protein
MDSVVDGKNSFDRVLTGFEWVSLSGPGLI